MSALYAPYAGFLESLVFTKKFILFCMFVYEFLPTLPLALCMHGGGFRRALYARFWRGNYSDFLRQIRCTP